MSNDAAGFVCDFCKKSFIAESSVLAHSCEKKRRWQAKDTKASVLGFYVFQKFHEFSFKSKAGSRKTIDQFIASQFYSKFVAFGKYILDINPVETDGFIEFVIKTGYKIQDWNKDSVYAEWIKELAVRESPFRAFERNIVLMQQWGRDYNENWIDFFRCINSQLATKWLCSGRISPWMLYSESGVALLSRLSDEQLNLTHDMISPVFWSKKLQDNREDLTQINALLKEYGI